MRRKTSSQQSGQKTREKGKKAPQQGHKGRFTQLLDDAVLGVKKK